MAFERRELKDQESSLGCMRLCLKQNKDKKTLKCNTFCKLEIQRKPSGPVKAPFP